ncbi:hypothetical protein BAE44_0018844 [Dichanthelium oligosanthes]|uniref:Uncharacterized protein n=1 Tax=Dichanthelium oligosanthes TaxID=888268 RepID=A0A1E5V569_9POAL|nr:hypothetical protein BAE44_0018844 [Dichanthelium oligosanthes]
MLPHGGAARGGVVRGPELRPAAGVAKLRAVRVVSGLPAASSRECLDILGDEVLYFRVVGGEHWLQSPELVKFNLQSLATTAAAAVRYQSWRQQASGPWCRACT